MKLLIATAAAVQREAQIPVGVRHLIEAASEVRVMSPSLVSPIEWLTGGVDSARASADQRLGVVLDQLAGLGVAASGTRGDELGPTAIDDALREFDADHVIISLPSARKEASQRNKVIDHLLDQRGVPITVFIVQD